MAEMKVVELKNFNRDLLREELTASALPFVSVALAGFERINQFVGAPTSEPRLVFKDGVRNIEDFAEPGELRFEFVTALTASEEVGLGSLLLAHDSTQRTVKQQRQERDVSDLDTLVANFPSFDLFTNTQFRSFVKVLARSYIRDRRSPDY